MSASTVISQTLLAAGILIVLLSCLGLAVTRDAFSKLHVVGPVTAISSALVAGGILAADGLGTMGVKAVVVFLILATSGPASSHAVARAARIHAAGSWDVRDEELDAGDAATSPPRRDGGSDRGGGTTEEDAGP